MQDNVHGLGPGQVLSGRGVTAGVSGPHLHTTTYLTVFVSFSRVTYPQSLHAEPSPDRDIIVNPDPGFKENPAKK